MKLEKLLKCVQNPAADKFTLSIITHTSHAGCAACAIGEYLIQELGLVTEPLRKEFKEETLLELGFVEWVAEEFGITEKDVENTFVSAGYDLTEPDMADGSGLRLEVADRIQALIEKKRTSAYY